MSVDVGVGDRVKVTLSGLVTYRSGAAICIDGPAATVRLDDPSVTVTLSTAKPRVGEIVSGRQVNAAKLKRGTILQGTWNDGERGQIVLTGEGRWQDIDSGRFYGTTVNPPSRFRVLHCPR